VILLDTDHVSVLRMRTNARRERLLSRIALVVPLVVSIPIPAVEETMRGWLAAIAKERVPTRQVPAYREFADLFGFFANFDIELFDDAAAKVFGTLTKIRIGQMDRKIASIALASEALLLTANRKDFEQVPGLRFENWMDG